MNGFLADFTEAVKQTSSNIVEAAVEIYNRMSVDLLPTPAKSHYVFNLRDLSKCVQGSVLIFATALSLPSTKSLKILGTKVSMTQLDNS